MRDREPSIRLSNVLFLDAVLDSTEIRVERGMDGSEEKAERAGLNSRRQALGNLFLDSDLYWNCRHKSVHSRLSIRILMRTVSFKYFGYGNSN